MKLSPLWIRRLSNLTYFLIGLTIISIIISLIQWWLIERSVEPLNVLLFATLSILTTAFGWLSRQSNVAPPTSGQQAISETPEYGPLRQKMSSFFNLDELRTLSLDLGIRYDSLNGDTIELKSASLLTYMQRRGQIPQLMAALERERPNASWPVPDQLRSRYNLRLNVWATWIDGVLRQSLSEAVALELKLTYQPGAVTRKVVHVPGQDERSAEQPIRDLFEIHGRSLLILGAPGSGKTMMLLQLAEALLKEVEVNFNQPVPIVLNLSSWAGQRNRLEDWLVEELLLQYQMPRHISRNWVQGDQLLYLLDGLDEVAADARNDCIAAINDFKAEHRAEMVVSSRLVDYEALDNRLNLGTALQIQPLTDGQIDEYLVRDELELETVRVAMIKDKALKSLARTPLFLSVMTLAYRGMSPDQLKTLDTPEAHRFHLYQAYVDRMFDRRPLPKTKEYDQSQSLQWLINLADGMKQQEQSVFYFERLQPAWLPNDNLRLRYALLVGCIGGIIGALIFGFSVWISAGQLAGLSMGVIGGLSVGAIGGLRASRESINLVEELEWSPQTDRKSLFNAIRLGIDLSLKIGAPIGLSLGIIFGLFYGVGTGLIVWLAITLIAGLVGGFLSWLQKSIQHQERKSRPRPNQGIHNSQRNALRMGIIFGLIFGLSIGVVAGLILALTFGLTKGLIIGLVVGLGGGLSGGLMEYGGQTVVRHYSLRWALASQNLLPFPFKDEYLITYLDDMVDRIFLRRVGGGWVFIHRTLLDFFATKHSHP